MLPGSCAARRVCRVGRGGAGRRICSCSLGRAMPCLSVLSCLAASCSQLGSPSGVPRRAAPCRFTPCSQFVIHLGVPWHAVSCRAVVSSRAVVLFCAVAWRAVPSSRVYRRRRSYSLWGWNSCGVLCACCLGFLGGVTLPEHLKSSRAIHAPLLQAMRAHRISNAVPFAVRNEGFSYGDARCALDAARGASSSYCSSFYLLSIPSFSCVESCP